LFNENISFPSVLCCFSMEINVFLWFFNVIQ
jgi:hypothetical protein